MEVVVEMEEMETVAHDLTRLVVSWRAALVRRRGVEQGWTHFFASARASRVARFWVLETATRVAIFRNRIFRPKKSTLSTQPFRLAPPLSVSGT